MDNIVVSARDIKKIFLYSGYSPRNIKQKIIHWHKKKDKKKIYYNALKNINFDVKKGEFLGIVGRNGSGKSTLLKILAQIYVPTSGYVKVVGKLVPFIELSAGFLPELSGRQNVYLNGALLGYSNKQVKKFYNKIVDFAELNDFMEKKLKNYSSGMVIRLGFSIASMVDADILLIDEILAVGDRDFQNKCYDYFENIHNTGKTVIFVSHDMDVVKKFCNRVIVIEKAKIIYDGNPKVAAKKYNKLFEK